MNDEEVIQRFLERVDALNLTDAQAGDAIGVTYESVRRYREKLTTGLRRTTRSQMLMWLGIADKMHTLDYRRGLLDAADELEQLVRRFRRMAAPDEDPSRLDDIAEDFGDLDDATERASGS